MSLSLVPESNVRFLDDYRPLRCEPPVAHVFHNGPGARCECGVEFWALGEVAPGVPVPAGAR